MLLNNINYLWNTILSGQRQEHLAQDSLIHHRLLLLAVEVHGLGAAAEEQPGLAKRGSQPVADFRPGLHQRIAGLWPGLGQTLGPPVVPETAERSDACPWTHKDDGAGGVFGQVEAWSTKKGQKYGYQL